MKKKRTRGMGMISVLTCIGILVSGCAKEPSDVLPENPVQDGEITGEITVSCYEAALYQSFLEDAAKQFEQKYPGTKVNIDTFSEMPEAKSSEADGEQLQTVEQKDNPQGRADYISKTSTSLMSGQGADLLAMDVLPVNKYVKAGQLENIKEYMENDTEFQRTDYKENILDALEFQNGIWFLPLNYSFDYWAYDSTLIEGGQNQKFGAEQAYTSMQLMNMGKHAFDGENQLFPAPAYLPSGSGDMFSKLFSDNYKKFVDTEQSTANFTDGLFAEMMQEIKDMADDGYIKQAVNQASDTNELLKSAENPTERFMFKQKTQFSLVQQTHPDSEFSMAVNTTEVGSGIDGDDEIAGIYAEESGVVPFSYGQAFGINANSPNKATAWAFLKFLLSYDIQSSPDMSFLSLSLHNQARVDRAKDIYRMMFAEGRELDEQWNEALQAYVKTMELMSDQINGYSITDTTIQDMVIKEAAYFFDGTKTAEQVSQVLQNKVELYLNE